MKPARRSGWRARGRSKRCEAVEAAAVEHQRRGRVRYRTHAAAFDFADEDHVVAFVVTAAVVTFEPRERAVEHRHPRVAGRMRDPFEAVALVGREALAQVELRRREHVHHVMTVAAEHGRRRRFVRETPQHQRRIERNRVERARGDADQLPGRCARRDHRHARSELAECLPEGGRVEIRRVGAAHRATIRNETGRRGATRVARARRTKGDKAVDWEGVRMARF